MTISPLMGLALDAKPIVAVGAMVLMVLLERAAPATPEGRASVRHDVVNLSIGLLNGAIGVLLAMWALPTLGDGGAGVLGLLGLSGAGLTLVALLLLDLWMYVWHRASHALPPLWRLHRTHHSDPSMDATTAVRFHPLEPALSHLLRVPIALGLGIVAEQVVLYEAILLPVIILHHSNLRVPPRLDRVLSLLIVTPGLHRSHHSPAQECRDRNYGSILSVWDRALGSLVIECRAEGHRFGLDAMRAAAWQGVRGLLATPFREVVDSGGTPRHT